MNKKRDNIVTTNIESYEEKVEILDKHNIQPNFEMAGILSEMKKDVETQQMYLDSIEKLHAENEALKKQIQKANRLVLLIVLLVVVVVVLFYFGFI